MVLLVVHHEMVAIEYRYVGLHRDRKRAYSFLSLNSNKY